MGLNLIELFEAFKKTVKTLKEDTIRLSEDSVDSQIDSVLLRYQDEASVEDEDVQGAMEMNEGYRMPENWKLLLEVDEDEEDEEGGEMPDDPSEVMSIGDDMPRSNKPADPRSQKLNIDDFAQKVANLYEHLDSLLNIKPVIIHRAMHLLERGYSGDLIDEFLETLEREFGITLEGDAEEEVPMAPSGGSAGPIGA